MDFTDFTLYAESDEGVFASRLFADEIASRLGKAPLFSDNGEKKIVFSLDKAIDSDDCYRIEARGGSLYFFARSVRGFIFAYGRFLRKAECKGGTIALAENIAGEYKPYMKIRGHQLGYRTTSNTYEACTVDEYVTYVKELMYAGCNTFEHTVFDDKPENRNALMKYSEKEFLCESGSRIKRLGADISYWYPNDEKTAQQSAEDRKRFFEEIPYADIYFPPGGDPGELEAGEFIERTVKIADEIRKVKPEIKVFPSAQSPHGFGKWGDDFISSMEKLPDEIDGVVTGPNCAMPLHELRERLPLKYPIRFYPDITHNVRCEHPVHFERDDWHYAFASTLGRECVNPRPREYKMLHSMTANYIVGSVSYSEGMNDDINKFVWSCLDFEPDAALSDILADYARLFFPFADTEKAVNGILGLEKNWEGDPAENPHIEATLAFFEDMLKETPALSENWRFLICLFRAKCDLLIKMRRVFEIKLIKEAKKKLAALDTGGARNALLTPFSREYDKLHEEIFSLGDTLFKKIGLQLDTEHYLADSWERGATLDTIDNPVTDRLWLLGRIEYAESLDESCRLSFVSALLARNAAKRGEYHFSFAENSLAELCERQEPYFYMNFQGDRPSVNNGGIPMSMLKIYDHYSLRFKTGGLTGKGYKLCLNIKPRYDERVTDFSIKVNGNTLYSGSQYGGRRDYAFERELSAPGFEYRVYDIPDSFIKNGCVFIEIEEPLIGITVCEIDIRR